MTSTFVGRQVELARMTNFLERVESAGPRVLVIEGQAGVGKSRLLEEFLQQYSTSGLKASGRGFLARCHSQVGRDNAYEPILDLIRQLQPRSRKWRKARLGARVLMESGTELAAGVLPGAGPALRAGVSAIRQHRSVQEQHVSRSVSGLTDAALKAVGQKQRTILAIDDAHLVDASSCLVLERLAAATDQRLAIILALRPHEIDTDSELRGLLDRLTVRGQVELMTLDGFDTEAIRDFVLLTYGVEPRADHLAQLLRSTRGLPFFLNQCLLFLYEQGLAASNGQWLDAPITGVPASVDLVVRRRIQQLPEEIRALLVLGAVQGEKFMSVVVERLCGMSRSETLQQLFHAQELGLIRLLPLDNWVRRTGSDLYEFDHALLHRVVYAWQSPQLRRDHHAAVAMVLEELMHTTDGAALEYRLDMVRHLHLGDEFGRASQEALVMARTLIAEGGSLTEAEQLCQQALHDVRHLQVTQDADRLRAEILELLLLCTEHKWSTLASFQEVTPLEGLVDEAADAAERVGDRSLQVRIAVLRGRVVHKTRGVDEGLAVQRQTIELAADGDAVMRFLTLSTYGRELTKRDLAAGLEVLQEAERLGEASPEIRESSDPTTRHAYFRAKLQIAVCSFDAGQLGQAKALLDLLVAHLRSTYDAGTLPVALNYLAQVQLAIGLWSEAGTTLQDAVQLSDDEPHAWHANNLALLGMLMVDRGEVEQGIRRLETAWNETKQAWQVNLAALVANLYAEGLLLGADGYPHRLAQADDLIAANIAECHRMGVTRSEAAAYTLRGRLLSMTGDLEKAVANSEQAVRLVEEHAPMPALRTEEVLYHHGLVLHRIGRHREAAEFCERAKTIVLRKATSLENELRDRFLTVPLNIAIVTGRQVRQR